MHKETIKDNYFEEKRLIRLNKKWDNIMKDNQLSDSLSNSIKMLEGCDHSSNSLINLINDLLDLAK